MAPRTMTEPAFFILTALLDAPRHGYGIVADVTELSQGRVQLKIGSLYGVLDRLVTDGLVEPDRDEAWQGRLRRYYRLTERGRHALAAETERLAANARIASARLRAQQSPIAGRSPS
ncbi:PadR family transcriptional regulator [Micromonospora sp. KC213]|uniref:PadR family transcriptional regulator n=1 Tax=Micromonospora sp. KC213 TaxID=2530378 RepID=UPI001FB59612|nr:PadR family transcriptional regulator [Micromonospora sp. KC213]